MFHHDGGGFSLIRLRRDGSRPLRFEGRIIAGHYGSVPNALVWHDLALYHVAAGGYVTAIVALRQRGNAPPTPASCHASLAATLDHALMQLENHDAARDICPGLSAPAVQLDDPYLSPAALMMHAAALHGLRQDVVRRYRIGVGIFLASLGRRMI